MASSEPVDSGIVKRRFRGVRAGRSRVRIDVLRDDLNAALFLLDQAEQALVDEFGAPADQRAKELLARYNDRIVNMRRRVAHGEVEPWKAG